MSRVQVVRSRDPQKAFTEHMLGIVKVVTSTTFLSAESAQKSARKVSRKTTEQQGKVEELNACRVFATLCVPRNGRCGSELGHSFTTENLQSDSEGVVGPQLTSTGVLCRKPPNASQGVQTG